jgi:hypothetical protein
MRDNSDCVVYCGLWLAEVNILSIQSWDKISNFILHISILFWNWRYRPVMCVMPFLEPICFRIRIVASKIWSISLCPCWRWWVLDNLVLLVCHFVWKWESLNNCHLIWSTNLQLAVSYVLTIIMQSIWWSLLCYEFFVFLFLGDLVFFIPQVSCGCSQGGYMDCESCGGIMTLAWLLQQNYLSMWFGNVDFCVLFIRNLY